MIRNRFEALPGRSTLGLSVLVLGWMLTTPVRAQCPTEPTLQNWSGAGTTACPCFVAGEEFGVILDAPASHYPIEILRIQVGWGSAVGGQPDTLEQSLNIYPAGLPTPGARQFSVAGPVLTDGVINDFDITILPGNRIVNSGPFMVSLEFANATVNDVFAPTAVHDGSNVTCGTNSILAVGLGWRDANSGCPGGLGVGGDWVMGVIYRQVNCGDPTITYCTGKTTSDGCTPFMDTGGSGLPSITDTNPFNVRGNDHKAGSSGLLVYSFSKANLNFHGGKLCVKSPIQRTAAKASKAKTPVSCVGPATVGRLVNNFNGRIQSGTDPGLTVGQKVFCQWQQRDPPNTIGGFSDNLSDGIRFTILP